MGPVLNLPDVLLSANPALVLLSSQLEEVPICLDSGSHQKLCLKPQSWLWSGLWASALIISHVWLCLSSKVWFGQRQMYFKNWFNAQHDWFLSSSTPTSAPSQYFHINFRWTCMKEITAVSLEDDLLRPGLAGCTLYPWLVSSNSAPTPRGVAHRAIKLQFI